MLNGGVYGQLRAESHSVGTLSPINVFTQVRFLGRLLKGESMSKLFSAITLLFAATAAFAGDSDLLTQLPRSTIRIQFHSVAIPDRAGVLELGRESLSSGNVFSCALVFNAFPPGKVLNGELLIADATVSYLWESRYYYHFWGKYSFDGSTQDFYELQCYNAREAITVGDFREYLARINGSLQ
jgi:hypothetical protein